MWTEWRVSSDTTPPYSGSTRSWRLRYADATHFFSLFSWVYNSTNSPQPPTPSPCIHPQPIHQHPHCTQLSPSTWAHSCIGVWCCKFDFGIFLCVCGWVGGWVDGWVCACVRMHALTPSPTHHIKIPHCMRSKLQGNWGSSPLEKHSIVIILLLLLL